VSLIGVRRFFVWAPRSQNEGHKADPSIGGDSCLRIHCSSRNQPPFSHNSIISDAVVGNVVAGRVFSVDDDGCCSSARLGNEPEMEDGSVAQ